MQCPRKRSSVVHISIKRFMNFLAVPMKFRRKLDFFGKKLQTNLLLWLSVSDSILLLKSGLYSIEEISDSS